MSIDDTAQDLHGCDLLKVGGAATNFGTYIASIIYTSYKLIMLHTKCSLTRLGLKGPCMQRVSQPLGLASS